MKKTLSLLILILALAPAAQAREFYSVKLKTTLTHSTLKGTKKMGTARGALTGGDDGAFSQLELNGKVLPVTVHKGWMGSKRRTNVKFSLSYETLRQIMHETNGSIWRSKKHERHVAELIDRYINREIDKAETEYQDCLKAATACTGYYCNRTCTKREGFTGGAFYKDGYYSDTDNTKIVLQFHDNESPESIHLVIDLANRASKL